MYKAFTFTFFIFGAIILAFVLLGMAGDAVGGELSELLNMIGDAFAKVGQLPDELANAEREFNKIGK